MASILLTAAATIFSLWGCLAKEQGAAEVGNDNDGCAAAGRFKTAASTQHMEGGQMLCKYPKDTNSTFPLLSFEHGDTLGGAELYSGYASFLETVASSGFVICAPLMCPMFCREKQHIHQLHAITAAKELGGKGILPVRPAGEVGVIGHSTGGMTTLKCAATDNVLKYGIGSAVTYNSDGPAGLIEKLDHVQFGDIKPSLPMFLVTGSSDVLEPKGSTQANGDAILKANPKQPLLVAEIKGEGHLDSTDFPLHRAPLKATPYIIAFFGYTLMPSDQCAAQYEALMGKQLHSASSPYYKNQLFATKADRVIV